MDTSWRADARAIVTPYVYWKQPTSVPCVPKHCSTCPPKSHSCMHAKPRLGRNAIAASACADDTRAARRLRGSFGEVSWKVPSRLGEVSNNVGCSMATRRGRSGCPWAARPCGTLCIALPGYGRCSRRPRPSLPSARSSSAAPLRIPITVSRAAAVPSCDASGRASGARGAAATLPAHAPACVRAYHVVWEVELARRTPLRKEK